jgi:hypothetical protein
MNTLLAFHHAPIPVKHNNRLRHSTNDALRLNVPDIEEAIEIFEHQFGVPQSASGETEVRVVGHQTTSHAPRSEARITYSLPRKVSCDLE